MVQRVQVDVRKSTLPESESRREIMRTNRCVIGAANAHFHITPSKVHCLLTNNKAIECKPEISAWINPSSCLTRGMLSDLVHRMRSLILKYQGHSTPLPGTGVKKWKSITSNPEADHQTPRDDFLTIIASLFYIVEEYSLA